MKAYRPIKIILADDHELFRDGFIIMMKKQPDIEVIGEASNGEELIDLTRKLNPDVIITDIKMPKIDGIEATKILSKEFPHIGIIALSMFNEDNLIVDMLEAGAKGYLLKNAHKDEIVEAIFTVNRNEPFYCRETSSKLVSLIAASHFNPYEKLKPRFSEKERAVINMICREYSTKEIASELNLSPRTIESYRENNF